MGNSKPAWQQQQYRRNVETRELGKSFLIVCEGEKTEPQYFKGFRVNTNVVNIKIEGIGYNTQSLVNEAISLKEGKDYDQVWCVFDRDSFPAQNFNAAFEIAASNDIRIAYSKEAFELWYLLHFQYYDSTIKRKEYYEMLTKLLNHKYEKNSDTIYDDLLNFQSDAIRNAKRLLSSYTPCKPERDNPSTTVHELVEELNKYVV